MADWSLPVNATAYASVLADLVGLATDASTLFVSAPTNQPTGAIRYLRASDKFQEWSGTAWVDKVLAIAGGGTGGNTAANARTSLGLGSIATQNNNAVNITGGTVMADLTGSTNIPASGLTGTIAQARLGSGSGGAGLRYLADDQTYKLTLSGFPPIAANQSADFTAAIENAYNLSGSHTVTLPSVIGIVGRIVLINLGGSAWTVSAHAGETVLGGSTWTFDFGTESTVTLVADANNTKWDVL